MDVSGASGQPRSGNDEPTEHPASPTAPAADHPGPRSHDAPTPSAGPEQPTTAAEPRPQDGDTEPHGQESASAANDGPPSAPTADPGDEPPARPATGTRDDHEPADTAAPAANPAPPSAATGSGNGTTRRPEAEPTPDGTASPTPPQHRTTPETAPGAPAHAAPPEDAPRPPATTAHASDTTSRTHADTGTTKARPPRRPREPGGGLLMGRPFGVPVYVAPSWFLVAALITWVFGGQLDRVLPELGAARYLVSLFFAVAFYASVLIHELAHTVAALRFKLPVRRIQLQFFGGVSEIEKEAETPGREFVLAFVGPLLSLLLAGLFYLAMLPVKPGTVPGVLLAGLMVSNLIVAAFNLLPGLPLDGGRMLRAVVWKITGRPMSGTIAAAWVGRALAVTVLIGLPLLTHSGALGATAEDNVGMDTVTNALLAAILAAIIWTGAGNSLRMARLREHLPELRARNLTRRAVPVETDTPLSEALRRANAAGARALVVVDAEGNPLSLVREAAIVGVPEHRRPWVTVSGLAQELTDGMRVSAELAGEDLLDTLRATPATEYLVVEDTGEIYGVLSAADVERAFVKAMARPTPST
ncbi:site-2 protease family protein [Streptomyces sp. NPDC051636]|uniref:site-2 protease family protein n=1 Tax=Streptomyces sp. NPDC051636 TaxID=3365663 RepID=UPI003799A4B0